ncbi:MAG: DUF3267 domain-containing protein [Anaerolineae bacterium]|nr:DUF3267 domain-containing protein [Anaerolineae bacterium]
MQATQQLPAGYQEQSSLDASRDKKTMVILNLAGALLISLVGLLLVTFLPTAVFPYLFVALVLNAAGSVGDLAMVGWLLFKPAHTLVRDTGPAIFIYY